MHLGPPRHSFTSTTRGRNGASKQNEDQELSPTGEVAAPRRSGGRAHDEAENEEAALRQRRDDRPRWGPRDSQPDGELERSTRDGRNKFDHPWARKDKSTDLDNDRQANPPWRRGPRDREHDRQEAEPEWADAEVEIEPSKAHTQADFVAWMQKMKGKDGEDIQPEMVQKESLAPVVNRAHRLPAADDKFFAKFEEKKNAEGAAAKPNKSRFASLFGAKEEPKPMETVHSAPIAVPVTAELEQPLRGQETEKKANDAAFAKLLQMLNKNQAASAAAAAASPNAAPAPIKQFNINDIAELASTRSPEPSTILSQSTRTPVAHTPNLSLDRIIESRSPAHRIPSETTGPPPAGAQDLLDLLRRSNLNDKPVQPPRYDYSQQDPRMHPPPGLSRNISHENERLGLGGLPINTRRDNPRGMFEDRPHPNLGNEQDYQRQTQSPDHGGLGSLFASMNQKSFTENGQQDPAARRGLARPPGLESAPAPRPPPGWPTSATQQRPPNPAFPEASQSINLLRQQPINPNYNPGLQRSVYEQNMYTGQPQPAQNRQPSQRNPAGEVPPPGFGNYPPGFGLAGPYNHRDAQEAERRRGLEQLTAAMRADAAESERRRDREELFAAMRRESLVDAERRRAHEESLVLRRDALAQQTRGNGVSVPPGFSR